MQSNSNDPLSLSEEAARLILDVEEHGSEDCEARLAAWLANSPAHIEAYLRTTIALKKFERTDAACDAAKRRLSRVTRPAQPVEPLRPAPRAAGIPSAWT